MEKKQQTSWDFVREVLEIYQIKSANLARMLAVDPATLTRYCKYQGNLNTWATCILVELWSQGTRLPPVAAAVHDEEAVTSAMLEKAIEALAKVEDELSKNQQRLAKMKAQRDAQQIKHLRLNQLDLNKSVFEEHQQKHWAYFIIQNQSKNISPEKIAQLELQIIRNQAEIDTLQRIINDRVKKS